MKKVLALALVLLLLTGLAACGGSKQSGAAPSADGGKGESQPASPDPVIKLSVFAGSIPKQSPTGVAMEVFIQEMTEKSGGSIQATAYYDTELGDATSMVQGLQQGTIDIGVSGDSYYSGLVPEIQLYELPFLFTGLEDARKAVDGPTKDIIFEKLEEKGLIGLCFWENGMRQLSNNVRPIKTPDDLKGIKMRTLPATIQVEAWKALGALPTSIDVSELYTALQVGTVSAQENPLAEIEYKKFYEVQPYITITNHVYTPFCMALSKKTAEKMTPEQLQIVKDASIVGQRVQRETAEAAQITAKENMLKAGIEFVEDPEIEKFQQLTEPVYEIYTQQCGDELLKMVREG